MYAVGIAKPVYIIIPSIIIAAGARACGKDRETDAIVLNIIDITNKAKNDINRKKKNAPGSRRRLVMKYSTMLKRIALSTL